MKDIKSIQNRRMESDLVQSTGVSRLHEHLEKCRNNFGIFPWVALIQSSGYGKTKCCYEECLRERCIYIQLMDKDGQLTAVHRIIRTIVRALVNEVTLQTIEKLAAKFIYVLLQAAAHPDFDTLEKLNEAQFKTGTFFDKVEELWSTVVVPNSSPALVRRRVVHFEADAIEVVAESAEVEAASAEPLPRINPSGVKTIFLDEAVALLSQKEPSAPESPIRCIQRQLKMLEGDDDARPGTPRVLLVVLSTLSGLSTMQPGHQGSRHTSLSTYPVVTFAYSDLFRNIPEIKSNPSTWLWTLGRPLWYAKLTEDFKGPTASAILSLISFAASLLTSRPKTSDNLPAMATAMTEVQLAHCAFALIFVSFQPHGQFGNYFVAQYLATLISVSNGVANHCKCSYPSEPILAEAVLHLCNQHPDVYSFPNIISAVKTQMISGPAILDISKGDLGEFVGAMLMLAQMKYIRDKLSKKTNHTYAPHDLKLSHSCEVPAILFLAEIGADAMKPTTVDLLADYVLNFTHFVRVDCVTDAVVMEAFARHAAIIVPRGETGVDLLMVMFDGKSGNYAAICLQVKNYINSIGPAHAALLLHSARSIVFASSHAKCSLFNSSCDVSMVLAVGKGGVKFSWFSPRQLRHSDRIEQQQDSKSTTNKSKAALSICASFSDFPHLRESIGGLEEMAALMDHSKLSKVSVDEAIATSGWIGLIDRPQVV